MLGSNWDTHPISITVDTYGKWMPNVKKKDLDESLRTKERS